MSIEKELSGRALILASGADNPRADQFILDVLKDFVFKQLDLQRIDLGGRTIVAMLIKYDPAHGMAISTELEKSGPSGNLDIGMMEIGNADR